jgi:hypothetical protein
VQTFLLGRQARELSPERHASDFFSDISLVELDMAVMEAAKDK